VSRHVTPAQLPYAENQRLVNGVRLCVAEAGEPSHPLAILLHGFPDFWQGWHLQIGALAAAGFRVLAPNQRGYGKSDKPPGIAAYDVDCLASDIIALASSEGYTTFNLIGHDWGGIVAWWVAARFPQNVARLIILNAPHPGIFRSYILRSPSQIARSWYVGFFQIPWLPEVVLAAANYGLLFRAIVNTSHPGIFDESDRKYLIAGWSAPGGLRAMIHYYRALVRRSERSLNLPVTVPTLVLFGKRDPTEEPGLAEASLGLCDGGRIMWLNDGRHWPQREEPAVVSNAIMQFISDPAWRPGTV
jgi:epoxide hydrolase 4